MTAVDENKLNLVVSEFKYSTNKTSSPTGKGQLKSTVLLGDV